MAAEQVQAVEAVRVAQPSPLETVRRTLAQVAQPTTAAFSALSAPQQVGVLAALVVGIVGAVTAGRRKASSTDSSRLQRCATCRLGSSMVLALLQTSTFNLLVPDGLHSAHASAQWLSRPSLEAIPA